MNTVSLKLSKYLLKYETPQAIAIDKSIEAVVELEKMGRISPSLTKRIIGVLLSKYVYTQIVNEIRSDMWGDTTSHKRFRYMKLHYDRREEKFS